MFFAIIVPPITKQNEKAHVDFLFTFAIYIATGTELFSFAGGLCIENTLNQFQCWHTLRMSKISA